MIANYTEEGWDLITQRSHGILAAQIAQHWQVAQRPERWTETLLAIAEHDDAMVELEERLLLTEAGGPLNFSMKKFELERCRRLSDYSISKSRYIALLTSMHMDFLYRGFEREDAQAKAFLADQRKLQAQWRRQLGLSKPETERIYSLVEWCDALSLLLCQRQMQPDGRTVEISVGPDGERYQLVQVNETQLSVTPWPFEPDSFKVSFESRTIAQLQFANTDELKEAFLAAPVEETVWEITKQKPKPAAPKVKAR